MQLTGKQIRTFQRLYQRRFGTSLSKKQAHEQGIHLLRFMEIVYKSVAHTTKQPDEVKRGTP